MPKGTTFRQNLRVGDELGRAALRTIGAVQLTQTFKMSAPPVSGVQCFVVPSSSKITGFRAYVPTYTGSGTIRFGAVGDTGSNLYGSITVDNTGAAVFPVITPGTVPTVWEIGSSSQPIGLSIVSASGDLASLSSFFVHVDYTRNYGVFDT